MSELHLWSLQLLFAWQLLWLPVQAAPVRRVALDPSLLTSIPTRPTEPWLSEQQVPPPNIYDNSESSLYVSEASVPTMEFPGQMESSATKEVSTQTSNEMVKRPTQPGILAEDLEKIEWFPFQQETLGQPIAEADATVLQPLSDLPEDSEVTRPNAEPVHAQKQTSSDITLPPLDLELTVTPKTTVEDHATALTPPTAPPKHSEVTVLVQVQQPTWIEDTVQDSDLKLFRTQQPETSEAGLPTTEQKLPMDICELCACYGSTLSCAGLSPEQKLRSVPVLYPNIYNHTFTIVNLQGNAISHIDKNTWKWYHSVEKLILGENNLKELHKNSFEGLISLQYLDLSSNKIQQIERNTFQSLPLLQHLNLQNNLMKEVIFGTFQAWHGMQSLHHLILSHNPLTTIEDPYLFQLPRLQSLDMGTTQVSLTTVERILMTTLKLEKLILPSHLVCCLCQFKKNIEAVSKTIKLNCDSDCLRNTHCDEELRLGRTEGSFMKILQGREENNCPELTIEPEGASSGESGDSFAALTNILKEFPSEQEAVKVSKVDWGTEGWKNGKREAEGEEDEQESHELTQEVPDYGYKSKFNWATSVVIVTPIFIILSCFIIICHKKPPETGKEGRDLLSSLKHERRSLEEGASWGRRPLWLWDMYLTFTAKCNRNVGQKLHQEDTFEEDEELDKMEKGEASMSTAKVATSASAEEMHEESEA